MDSHYIYASGKPSRRIRVDAVLDAISDQVLSDGDVEKALQRAFRFGTEDDIGLLDILDRLREEIAGAQHSLHDPEQHEFDMEAGPSERRVEDAIAMREALRQVESLEDLKGIDPDLMNKALTTEEREWIDKWSDLTGQMIESGLVALSGSRMVLTPKAIRRIGSKLLQHMFIPPAMRGRGSHQVHQAGLHGMPGEDTTEWEWGKAFDLNIGRTMANAVRRSGIGDRLNLSVEDFEVFERESGAAVHTVLMIDMSRSMFESGAWDAARRAAIALNSLIELSRQQDELGLVGFSGDAQILQLDELPGLSWDQFSHGTNLHAGLLVASQLFRNRHAMNRQIVIITDGEPTAFMDGDLPVFEHPVTRRTLESTLREARRLARRGVNITTISVGEADAASDFARTLTRVVNGRLIQLPVDQLGSFVVRDVARGTIRALR